MNFLNVIFFLVLFLFSCTKEEKVDSCSNGFFDPGETKVDCGGTCPPCPLIFFPKSNFIINNVDIAFNEKSVFTDNGNYFLNVLSTADSVEFTINLGPNLDIQQGPISPVGTFAIKKGNLYNVLYDANFAIIKNDVTNRRLSGLLSFKIECIPFPDVLNIPSGSFSDISY